MDGGPTVGARHRPGALRTIVGIGIGLGQLYPGIGTVTMSAVLVTLVHQEVQTMANQKYPMAVRTRLKTHQRHHTTQSMTKKILPRLNFPVMVNM